MKTAVEWLEIVLISEPYSEEDFEHNERCWEQAKEREKEQSNAKIQKAIEKFE